MDEQIHYVCQRCTNCCRWPGLVRITDGDIAAMSAHFGLSERDFIDRYTQLRPHRDGLALLNKQSGECIFLEGRDCVVQNAKPTQCKGFPNTWNFPGWRNKCEAVPTLRKAG